MTPAVPFDLELIRRREQLFWRHVARRGDEECWLWTGTLTEGGYGRIKRQGRMISAHRVAFALTIGYVPAGMVCHHCDTPACCNPIHLYEGTAATNSADKVRRGRGPTGQKNGRYTHPETTARGESHGRARLTAAQVAAIRKLLCDGGGLSEIGRQYGISPQLVYQIRKGDIWRGARGE